MANHDYVIDNGSGSTVRADINNALQAIASVNSSASEPSTLVDKMLWHDTTSNALKQRNSGSFTGLRLFDPRIINTGLLDANGNEALGISATASAVNQITIANAITGNAPILSATGDDANINLTLTPKGSASIFVPNGSVTNPSISVSTDSNTGIYFPSADTMGFVEGGTGYQMGYRNVPSAGANKTTNYTLQLSDRGKLVSIGTSGQITVPPGVFSAGDIIYVYNDTGSPFNINRGSGVQLYKSGVDSNVSAIAVPTRTIGAIQYVSDGSGNPTTVRAVFFSGSQDDITFQLEYVIVGGGGGGGNGGGGAGGYIAGRNSGTVDGINYGTAENQGGNNIPAEKPIFIKKGVAYNVAIGAGGAAAALNYEPSSTNGTDTYFNNLIAIGGGGGKPGFGVIVPMNSAARLEQFSTIVGGSNGGGVAGSVRAFARQGNLGGGGTQANTAYGANGGGGASAAGVSTPVPNIPSSYNGMAGGAGLTTNILAASETLAGGGGGGAGSAGTTGGAGGAGGGGAGGVPTGTGTAGSVNTGGGGGGRGHSATSATGTGGSGVILLRYPNTITATSSQTNNVNDLTMTESTTTVDNITFKTLKITAGIGTVTFN